MADSGRTGGAEHGHAESSVVGVAAARWGVLVRASKPVFTEPGWQYFQELETRCPTCSGPLHSFYRPHPNRGKVQLQTAVVCPHCATAKSAREMTLSTKSVLGDLKPEAVARRLAEDAQLAALSRERFAPSPRPPAPAPAPQARPEPPAAPRRPTPVRREEPPEPPAPERPVSRPLPPEPPAPEVSAPRVPAPEPSAPERPAVAVSTTAMAATVRRILASSEPTFQARPGGPDAADGHGSRAEERRLLHWCKTADPDLDLPPLPEGTDVRVLLPEGPRFDALRVRLAERGVPFRSVAHWVEQETISSLDADSRLGELWSAAALAELGGVGPLPCGVETGEEAAHARDAFEHVWAAHDPALDSPEPPRHAPAEEFVPRAWLDYLPFPTLNPAQAQAAPVVVDGDGHVVITAPTGAGKTVIGMMAALRTVLDEGRKAAWLVPQRSLTDELDRELEVWRRHGLRVERLSGEHTVDVERVREADLWVATTEKFESLCRAASMQAALAEVGCMVVDEIHLLGDVARGALLEALLARVRGAESPVRIVGLSATVSNAAEIAEWLEGELVTTTWRPSRLTWQLPAIPATSTQRASSRAREHAVVDLTRRITAEQGGVLVFCGSKANVRSTALAVAADRGAVVDGLGPHDADKLQAVCAQVGVQLHYADWEHKHAAERAFRRREADVLVATTTVAAGVNLPARAVVVRDTRVGTSELSTATVLQMFGRAGRVGAGETEGWAYLVTDETERARWQGRLVRGYAVYSQIYDSLPDHVLAEVLQSRITTLGEAEAWWVQTLAHAQGDEDLEPVQESVRFLLDRGFLDRVDREDGEVGLQVAELGRLTARLMVSSQVGARLNQVLGMLPVPDDPDTAEVALTSMLSAAVPALLDAPVGEAHKAAVATAIKARGRTSHLTEVTAVQGLGSGASGSRGDLAWAAMLLVANSPHLFDRSHGPRRVVAGIPASTLHQVLEQAPRYLAWLAAQGVLGTIHPWVAIVAGDLDRRIRWREVGPGRGAGRLLWMCEQMATRARARELVPRMWRDATGRGLRSPDWPGGAPPPACELDRGSYTALLRERASAVALEDLPDGVRVSGATGTFAAVWTGHLVRVAEVARDPQTVSRPPAAEGEAGADQVGAAVFTRRGDHRATGWLTAYDALSPRAVHDVAARPRRPLAGPAERRR
ncbi:DEAD/DEAH box helicase [Umezawaea beigongshangensis]|uniref:DEAD/DEAH box helicase n=1 Tax=Umezawaea beigongshangensis TaxID=2780383 RepID=UPI0018F18683|nr:DEAD/DEAH box helicase [Umezawaea beigongshangensis]